MYIYLQILKVLTCCVITKYMIKFTFTKMLDKIYALKYDYMYTFYIYFIKNFTNCEMQRASVIRQDSNLSIH